MLALVLFPLGCTANRPGERPGSGEATAIRFEYARVVMGSRARIVVYAGDEATAIEASREAFGEMDRLNLVLSDYTAKSEAMRLCASPAGVAYPVSADLLDVMLKASIVHEASGGAFDPSLGALTSLWRVSFKSGVLPERPVLEDARARSGLGLIEIDAGQSKILIRRAGVKLDFGAIGKGYAADRALDVLARHGLNRAMVDLGGDLALGDSPPAADGWEIAASNDRGDSHPLLLSNVGVATSGDTYRSVTIDGVRYSHILDPRTGLGLRSSQAVTVTAEEAWLADALASAASVLGPEGCRRLTERWPSARTIWLAPRAPNRANP